MEHEVAEGQVVRLPHPRRIAQEDAFRRRAVRSAKVERALVGQRRFHRHGTALSPAVKQLLDKRQVVPQAGPWRLRVRPEGTVAVVIGKVGVVDAGEHIGAHRGRQEFGVAVVAGVVPVGILDRPPVPGVLTQDGQVSPGIGVAGSDAFRDRLPARRVKRPVQRVDLAERPLQPVEQPVLPAGIQKAPVLFGRVARRQVEHLDVRVGEQRVERQPALHVIRQQMLMAGGHRQAVHQLPKCDVGWRCQSKPPRAGLDPGRLQRYSGSQSPCAASRSSTSPLIWSGSSSAAVCGSSSAAW